MTGVLRLAHRRHVASVLLQHDEHPSVAYGDSRDWLRLAIHPYVATSFRVSENSIATGASMTLVGLVPPLCDNGSLLVDGGYRKSISPNSAIIVLTKFHSVDNLPVCDLVLHHLQRD